MQICMKSIDVPSVFVSPTQEEMGPYHGGRGAGTSMSVTMAHIYGHFRRLGWAETSGIVQRAQSGPSTSGSREQCDKADMSAV